MKWGKKFIKILMLGSVMLLSIFACEDNVNFKTPNLPVYVELNLQQSANRPLMTPGGIVLIDEPRLEGERLGFGGLAVVRDQLETKFYAFDLACPYENNASVLLEIDGFFLKCPECKSEFDVISGFGAPTKLPARTPLRRYHCSYNSRTDQLLITN